MAEYSKAIGAFLTGLVGLLAQLGVSEVAFFTPELISGITMVISTGIVWFVTNKKA